MANSAMWMGDVAAWAKHFRVYAVDIIGDAGFSAPSRPPLASEAHALWLDDVVQALSLAHTSMAGVSFGGWLAPEAEHCLQDRPSANVGRLGQA
jgi:pimeloyl-ACP methyl ester carboxylesterase